MKIEESKETLTYLANIVARLDESAEKAFNGLFNGATSADFERIELKSFVEKAADIVAEIKKLNEDVRRCVFEKCNIIDEYLSAIYRH